MSKKGVGEILTPRGKPTGVVFDQSTGDQGDPVGAHAPHTGLVSQHGEIRRAHIAGYRAANVGHTSELAPREVVRSGGFGHCVGAGCQRHETFPRENPPSARPSGPPAGGRVREFVEQPQTGTDPREVAGAGCDRGNAGQERGRDGSVGTQRAKRIDAARSGRAGVLGGHEGHGQNVGALHRAALDARLSSTSMSVRQRVIPRRRPFRSRWPRHRGSSIS